eukprot:TRINITY_DN11321_c0_g1_i2.p2 TRINITY_DN11321_c0_g1~~TRINITY_DN11321_c0_g1_i2.p2  ORF type:complete len:153 (+),score=28.04 TRINITY_DN11321_c0_g1_i2:131-589(+)
MKQSLANALENSCFSTKESVCMVSLLADEDGRRYSNVLPSIDTCVTNANPCQTLEPKHSNYFSTKALDNRYLEELRTKAAVERELEQRKSMEAQGSGKSWGDLQVARAVRVADSCSLLVIPVRPTNPQCRDPLFIQFGHKEVIMKKPDKIRA